MTTRRTLLGAPKWAFRDLRRELATDCWTLVIVLVLTTVMLVRIASAKLEVVCGSKIEAIACWSRTNPSAALGARRGKWFVHSGYNVKRARFITGATRLGYFRSPSPPCPCLGAHRGAPLGSSVRIGFVSIRVRIGSAVSRIATVYPYHLYPRPVTFMRSPQDLRTTESVGVGVP
jgi:hypothetical protein